MPLSVLEAMAAGLPVASTDVGDVDRMVAPSGRSFVSGQSALELTTSLSALIENKALRSQLGKDNRTVVERDFDLRVMVEAFRRLYLE